MTSGGPHSPDIIDRLARTSVTFGVPTYNEGSGVRETLDSLRVAAAACGLPLRVMLSDSSETTATVDAARAWSEGLADVQLTIDRSERRRSLKEANNVILAAAESDLLVVAVGDVLVPPHSLSELLLALTDDPRPAVAFGCSFPDPAARALRYRASAWQMRATWRLASLLPDDFPRADGALWGAARPFYADYRFPVGDGAVHDDAELLSHLVHRGLLVRNAWRAIAMKIPAGTYADFRAQTCRWFQVASGRTRVRGELRAALLEAVYDPVGAGLYAIGRARLVFDRRARDLHDETWDVTYSTKR